MSAELHDSGDAALELCDRNVREAVRHWSEAIAEVENARHNPSEREARRHFSAIRERVQRGQSLDEVLPEVFHLTRAVSERAIGLRHYPEQVVAGMCLHLGCVVEMATGEGKTLVATLPACLNALTGSPTYVVTVNDYLARRDMEWMAPVYRSLGLTVGLVTSYHDASPHRRRQSYDADIVYVTSKDLIWDFLRDRLVYQPMQVRQKELSYAIVDEIDSVLLDEAQSPFVIMGARDDTEVDWSRPLAFAQKAREHAHYELEGKQVAITDGFRDEILRSLRQREGFDYDGRSAEFLLQVQLLLRAKQLVEERDYLREGDSLTLIDPHSDRPMPGRRLGDGLHEALEAWLGLRAGASTEARARISYKEFFKKFSKLAGMTGTAVQSAAEFAGTYDLSTVRVRTHSPEQRTVLPDRIFRSKASKLQALAQTATDLQQERAPVLIGGPDPRENQQIHDLLMASGVPPEQVAMLSARSVAAEADIIAKAGVPGRITIATNLAGRGTDIVLGGAEPRAEASFEPHVATGGEQGSQSATEPADDRQALAREARERGGLHVMLVQRQESARRDRQFIGRCARQGDPGTAIAFGCCEDELLRHCDTLQFDGEELAEVSREPYRRWVVKQQEDNERLGHAQRATVAHRDATLGRQRDAFYALREDLLQVRLRPEDLRVPSGQLIGLWFEPETASDFERGTRPDLWHFPAHWLASGVEQLLADAGWSAPGDGTESIERSALVHRILGAAAARYFKQQRARPEFVERSDTELVLLWVVGEISRNLSAFAPLLAMSFVRVAALACLDEGWTRLLNEYELRFDELGPRSTSRAVNVLHEFQRERFEDFKTELISIRARFVRILLDGVPKPRGVQSGSRRPRAKRGAGPGGPARLVARHAGSAGGGRAGGS